MNYDITYTETYYRLCISNEEGQVVLDMLHHDDEWDTPLMIINLREPDRPRSMAEVEEVLALIDEGWHWMNLLRLGRRREGWHPRMVKDND